MNGMLVYGIAGNFRGIKISPRAHTLYCDKNVANYNFPNSSGGLQEVVGGGRESRACSRSMCGKNSM